jgi:hypothetical protein
MKQIKQTSTYVFYVYLSTLMSQLAKFCAAFVFEVKTHTKRSQAILIFNIIHVHFHLTVLGQERTWKLCTAIRTVPS